MQVGDHKQFEDEEHPEHQSLVRLARPIMFNPEPGGPIDSSIVSPRFYNSFNYSMIDNQGTVSFVLGVTSAHAREGKTLVASNLAVSLAVGNGRETILVDFNLGQPRIHSIFGTKISPGLTEAFTDRTVRVSRTQVKHLYVLSAGSLGKTRVEAHGKNNGFPSMIGLGGMTYFRDIIYSLKSEFEFIVVDLPAISDPSTPMLLASQMNGMLMVVDTTKTKRDDIETAMHRMNKNRVIGFVLNRVPDMRS